MFGAGVRYFDLSKTKNIDALTQILKINVPVEKEETNIKDKRDKFKQRRSITPQYLPQNEKKEDSQ